uniref:Uncharacterized protein n=1 Tax=Arion vulgaris TaxID=1028688 RepID=A0A0B6Z0J6_9EUPU
MLGKLDLQGTCAQAVESCPDLHDVDDMPEEGVYYSRLPVPSHQLSLPHATV